MDREKVYHITITAFMLTSLYTVKQLPLHREIITIFYRGSAPDPGYPSYLPKKGIAQEGHPRENPLTANLVVLSTALKLVR